MKKLDFEHFINAFLLPRLSPGDVLVMDNLASHRSSTVHAALNSKGVKIIFTPPYCPEFNPIELVWAVMKSRIKKRASVKTEIRRGIGLAWRSLRNLDFCRFIKSCGYRLK